MLNFNGSDVKRLRAPQEKFPSECSSFTLPDKTCSQNNTFSSSRLVFACQRLRAHNIPITPCIPLRPPLQLNRNLCLPRRSVCRKPYRSWAVRYRQTIQNV